MSGAIKKYSVQGNGVATGADVTVVSQVATIMALTSCFNKLNTLLSEFDFIRISSIEGETLIGETSGTFYFSETYKIDGFTDKYLVFTIQFDYRGFVGLGNNFYIYVCDTIPLPKSSAQPSRISTINYTNYVSAGWETHEYNYDTTTQVYNGKASFTIPLKITKTLNSIMVNIYNSGYNSMSSLNGYGIFNLTNDETSETTTYIGKGNYCTSNNQNAYITLFDSDKTSRGTATMFLASTLNPISDTQYCITSDVYLTPVMSLTLPSTSRATQINQNTTIDKSQRIKNLIQTTSFFNIDDYYQIDGKTYIALGGNLLSEFDPNYVFPEL